MWDFEGVPYIRSIKKYEFSLPIAVLFWTRSREVLSVVLPSAFVSTFDNDES